MSNEPLIASKSDNLMSINNEEGKPEKRPSNADSARDSLVDFFQL